MPSAGSRSHDAARNRRNEDRGLDLDGGEVIAVILLIPFFVVASPFILAGKCIKYREARKKARQLAKDAAVAETVAKAVAEANQAAAAKAAAKAVEAAAEVSAAAEAATAAATVASEEAAKAAKLAKEKQEAAAAEEAAKVKQLFFDNACEIISKFCSHEKLYSHYVKNEGENTFIFMYTIPRKIIYDELVYLLKCKDKADVIEKASSRRDLLIAFWTYCDLRYMDRSNWVVYLQS